MKIPKTPLLAATIVGAGLALTACQGWYLPPPTYAPPTLVPSRTPVIQTATPMILSTVPTSTAAEATFASATPITPTPQDATSTPTFIPTLTASASVIKADVLGCDTSVDITHGLGEVTNAYVTISNPTLSGVTDMCATLSALDEGRPHPDKTKCVPSLDSGYQLTLKLTVDTTYQQQTPIQIDITSQGNLLLRVGEPACTAIGLLLPAVSEIGIPKPIP